MDLALTETDQMIKQLARDFVEKETPKGVLLALDKTDTGYTDDIWHKIADIGLLGMIIPKEYGGDGNTFTSAGVLFEELGRGPVPGPYFSSSVLSSLIVLEAGSQEQKTELLPAICRGERVATLALTEADYGWGTDSIRMTARVKNGDFVLNGMKLYVLDAGAASDFIVVAHTRAGSSPAGIRLFRVEKASKGVSVRRLPGFLGWSYEVKFDSVRVPRSAMLGEDGWEALQRGIIKSIPMLSAYKAGGCQAVLGMSLQYCQERVQFGKPIGQFERVQDHVIEILSQMDAARWVTYEALWKLDTGLPAAESAHMAKAVSSEAYWRVCTLGHFIHAAMGLSKEYGLMLHTRASRTLYNFLGDPGYHKRKLGGLLGFAP